MRQSTIVASLTISLSFAAVANATPMQFTYFSNSVADISGWVAAGGSSTASLTIVVDNGGTSVANQTFNGSAALHNPAGPNHIVSYSFQSGSIADSADFTSNVPAESLFSVTTNASGQVNLSSDLFAFITHTPNSSGFSMLNGHSGGTADAPTLWHVSGGRAKMNGAGLPTLQPVPEPSSILLLSLGAAGLGAFAWHRSKRAAKP